MKGGGFADDKDYIVVGGRNSGKLYAYYQNPHASGPIQVNQIVTSSNYPSNYPNMDHANDAMNRITQFVTDLQNRNGELTEQLEDAYKKIEGQEKFIEILQRQIAIAEKYIINDDRRNI
jgi:peptidoglycan hydrolase CwlO-like protein